MLLNKVVWFFVLVYLHTLLFFQDSFTKCLLKTLRATVALGQRITDNTYSSQVVRLLRHTPCTLYLHRHINNFLYKKYFKTDVMLSCGNV